MQSFEGNHTAENMGSEQLRLAFYAKFLPFVFSMGVFMVFIVAYLTIKGLKDDYDNSFPEPLLEVSLLNDFQSQYMLETINILQHNKKGVSPYTTSIYQWNLYKNFAQSLEEQGGMFDFLRTMYQSTFLTKKYELITTYQEKKLRLIQQIEDTITLEVANMATNNRETLYEHARTINSLSTDIINTQVTIHTLEKESTDYFHNTTIGLLCAMTALVFCIVICIDILVIGFIRRLNQYLKKRFDRATAELRNLNTHLQKEIDKQVEDMRQKDMAMYIQSKLATMGEMVQNIAHQWRNPLNALTLVIQDLQLRFHKNTLTKEVLDRQTTRAIQLAESMSNTIESFRNFFRLEPGFTHFNIKDALNEAIAIHEPLFEANRIQFHLDYEDDADYRIFGNKHALIQIVLIILGNAKDVFQERKIQNPHCHIDMEVKNSILSLHIYDNAGGIDESIVDRIFDQYFTTKKSKGTGIGLYMAKSMIQHLHGEIEARNITFNSEGEYCQGALFVLKLQLSNAAMEEQNDTQPIE